jgi:hypothetical protein
MPGMELIGMVWYSLPCIKTEGGSAFCLGFAASFVVFATGLAGSLTAGKGGDTLAGDWEADALAEAPLEAAGLGPRGARFDV